MSEFLELSFFYVTFLGTFRETKGSISNKIQQIPTLEKFIIEDKVEVR